jgi:hypothetical protein
MLRFTALHRQVDSGGGPSGDFPNSDQARSLSAFDLNQGIANSDRH